VSSVTDEQSHGPAVVPRWEWRTFGGELGEAERQLTAIGHGRVQESDEVYLLSTNSDASVKLRDELVDVKRLERVDGDGLELWNPIMKESFPLTAAAVAVVLTTLGVTGLDLNRPTYTREEFAGDFEGNPDLLAVEVHKRRTHYAVDECMVELTGLDTRRGSVRTIAIESPDPALVVATIRRLGLAGRRNVSMAQGLKTLFGFGGRRYGVIDVGTNSVKLFLADVQADGEVHAIADDSDVTRLGEGLDASGRLGDEPMERTAAAIAAFVDQAREAGAIEIAAVGTAGLRSAANRSTFVDAVLARCGVAIEVVSGDEEARLAYLAATSALPASHGSRLVFDSGGGSSQFTFGHDGEIEERFSVDVGAARVADRAGLTGTVSREGLADALDVVGTALATLDGRGRPDQVVAMGGTVTNLAAVKHELGAYDPEIVRGTVLDLQEIDRQIELYRTRTADERRAIPGLQPNRAEVILAGACIVRTILTKLGQDSVTVTDRGLRHGLFAERFAH
jgi:exopolyphosphatase/guanosine-5'-triphosphate,3'-diphosphate pyrophosphatase